MRRPTTENDKMVKASDVKEYFKRVIFGADQKTDAWVDSIPAADVVEVVRCGQCKHGLYTGTEWFCDKHSGHADRFGEDASYHEYHSKYWFCADGEKRADNG